MSVTSPRLSSAPSRRGLGWWTRPTLLVRGERVARIRDAQGHLWWLHERVEDVPPNELGCRFAHRAAREAMAYVQQSLREEPRPENLPAEQWRGPAPPAKEAPGRMPVRGR